MHIQLHTYIKLFVCGEVSISFFLWFRLDEHSGGFGGGGRDRKKEYTKVFSWLLLRVGRKKGRGGTALLRQLPDQESTRHSTDLVVLYN